MTYPDEFDQHFDRAFFDVTGAERSVWCAHCGAPSGGTGCCWPPTLTEDGHLCTADCFTFAERAGDPTIDDHFNARGAHKCSAAHDGMVQA